MNLSRVVTRSIRRCTGSLAYRRSPGRWDARASSALSRGEMMMAGKPSPRP